MTIRHIAMTTLCLALSASALSAETPVEVKLKAAIEEADLFCILLLTLIATFFVFTCSFLIVRVYFTVFIIPFIVLIKVIYFIPLFFYNSILCLFDLFLFLLVKCHF